jgi:hypothetical protein
MLQFIRYQNENIYRAQSALDGACCSAVLSPHRLRTTTKKT